MADRTLDGLRACITSLDRLIAPAVQQAGDQLAAEQVSLISKYLGFLVERLDHTEARSTLELKLYTETAENVLASLSEASQDTGELSRAIGTARAALDGRRPKAEIESASIAVQAELSHITRGVRGLDPALRRRIEKAIVDGSIKVLDLQRAWVVPQAWESRDKAPDFEAIIRQA